MNVQNNTKFIIFRLHLKLKPTNFHLKKVKKLATNPFDQKKLMKSKIFRKVTMLPIRSIKTVVDFVLTYFPITFGDDVR